MREVMGRRICFVGVSLGLACLLSACGGSGEQPGDVPVFSDIGPDDTLTALGTEPFWNAESVGESLTYSTPDNIDGTVISIERFAGNGGLGLYGDLNDEAFQLAITPGECSDGMSNRTYPFTATLTIGNELREGCAFTSNQPFTGDEAP